MAIERKCMTIFVSCLFLSTEPGAEKEKITKLVKSEESKAAKKSEK